jgi:hypothetical protein
MHIQNTCDGGASTIGGKIIIANGAGKTNLLIASLQR